MKNKTLTSRFNTLLLHVFFLFYITQSHIMNHIHEHVRQYMIVLIMSQAHL